MKQIHCLFMITLVCMLTGCRFSVAPDKASDNSSSRTVFAMDTVMELTAYGENAEEALVQSEQEINRLDGLLRRGDEKSEVYKLNQTQGGTLSEDTKTLIATALNISQETDGAFDITVAPVMDLWGFYTKEFRVPTETELSVALDTVDYRRIHLDGGTVSLEDGTAIDLGGIAKGYLSDQIMEIYRNAGVTSGIVSLGGNVQTLGSKPDGTPWRVGIEDPDDTDDLIGVLSVTDKAVITSGSYQRFFEENGITYHHIIDPKTGCPAKSGLKSVTVVADRGILADGLSTALFVMGLEAGGEFWRTHDDFEAVFITDTNRIYITQGLQSIFESSSPFEVITK